MLKNLRGSIILLVTAIIWGTSFVAQSEGMKYVEPFTYNSIRTLIGGIVLLPVIAGFKLFSKSEQEENKTSLKATLIGGVFCGLALCIASSFQQVGIVYTTAGKSGFITALYVILVPILGLVLGNKTPKKIWFCVALAIVGFYLLCIKGDFRIGIGDLLTLICAFFFAIHIIVIDRFISKGADGVAMACVQFFTSGIISFIIMLLFESPKMEYIYEARFTILYAGVLSCGVAYTLQIVGQRFTAPTVATLIMSLESVFAALSGWLIIGEQLSVKELFGCVLVFAAVVFAQVNLPSENKKLKKRE
ncbi:MAG: DMT family transporter [Ruminococcus sp.]|nr:DMT family transporter [Ruminococcus sp.]